MINFIHILLIIFSVAFPAPQKPMGKVAVIVHSSTKTEAISPNQLLDIYTLNSQNWSDGKKIYITDFKGDSEIRTKFYSSMSINKNDIKRIWLRKQFSGSGTPPLTVTTNEEMIEKVLSKPGTIGYVPADQIPENTKVILTID